ncbi:hypothetical protein EDC04DRAFT_3089534 [Pisolithus marmoratus]|nr:hypothetical protein EDC04DRAFT_3089534 [Pisolithus marmoratus]
MQHGQSSHSVENGEHGFGVDAREGGQHDFKAFGPAPENEKDKGMGRRNLSDIPPFLLSTGLKIANRACGTCVVLFAQPRLFRCCHNCRVGIRNPPYRYYSFTSTNMKMIGSPRIMNYTGTNVPLVPTRSDATPNPSVEKFHSPWKIEFLYIKKLSLSCQAHPSFGRFWGDRKSSMIPRYSRSGCGASCPCDLSVSHARDARTRRSRMLPALRFRRPREDPDVEAIDYLPAAMLGIHCTRTNKDKVCGWRDECESVLIDPFRIIAAQDLRVKWKGVCVFQSGNWVATPGSYQVPSTLPAFLKVIVASYHACDPEVHRNFIPCPHSPNSSKLPGSHFTLDLLRAI